MFTKEEILRKFPISRDPPEGGTTGLTFSEALNRLFPISRDPPEGGTLEFEGLSNCVQVSNF